MGVSTDTWGGGVPLLATSPFPPCGMWCYPRHPQFDLGRGFGARQLLVPHPAACWEEPPAPLTLLSWLQEKDGVGEDGQFSSK